MGFIRNWRADRANGTMKVKELRMNDALGGIERSRDDQKRVEKAVYEFGVSVSKSNRLSKSEDKTVNKTSNRTTNIHNEANGAKLEVKQAVGFQKNSNNGKNIKSYKPKKSTKSKK